MRFYPAIEDIIKRQGAIGLKVTLKRYGYKLRVYKQKKDVYGRVYGSTTGSYNDTYKTIIGIATGDDFFPAGPASSGQFEEGWLYTMSEHVAAGDMIEIKSKDGKSRRFTVKTSEDLGATTEVFNRWKLVAMVD
ncbi:MAG: hypothetical protein ACW991_02875 [Candidatus Hodarchaeales archaeon]|jgi:hypothetical protein